MTIVRSKLQKGLGSLVLAMALGCTLQDPSIPPPEPEVELNGESVVLSVAPDTTGLFRVKVHSLNGYAGTAELFLETQGTDLTGSVSPTPVVFGAEPVDVLISVDVPVSAAAGVRNLILHARGKFVEKMLPLAVTVPAARLLPISTFTNSIPANLPFMAFKDGDAPWRPLNGQGGAYRAAITDPAGRYGLAYGYICTIDTFQSFQMNYLFQTLSESGSLGVTFICNPEPGPSPTYFGLEGALRGQGSASGYLVTSGGSVPFEGSTSAYQTRVLQGKGDLTGWTFANSANHAPTRFFLERGRETTGNTVRHVDFATDGFDPGPAQAISYGPVGSDATLQGIVRYFTLGGQYFGLGDGSELSSYVAFPSARGEVGDSYGYGFAAFDNDHSEMVYGGGEGLPGPLAINFPTPVPPLQVDWLTAPYARPRLRWSSVSPRPRLQQFSLSQTINLEQVYWYLLFSQGWLTGSSHDLQIPDFTGLTGWNDRWAFRSGNPVQIDHGQFGSMGSDPSINLGMEKAFEMMLAQPSSGRSLLQSSSPGKQLGGFHVVGLPSPPKAKAAQASNAFSASRRMNSTP
ncbi:MAG: hypothetical protein Q8O00_06975 [Holophaga sp.]|nr:hypothetical protein [Holophaga sp.]